MTIERLDIGAGATAPFAVDRVGAARLCGVSPSQWDRWRKAGRTPEPCLEDCDDRGRPRLVRWYVEDIRRWLADGANGRTRRASSARGKERSR